MPFHVSDVMSKIDVTTLSNITACQADQSREPRVDNPIIFIPASLNLHKVGGLAPQRMTSSKLYAMAQDEGSCQAGATRILASCRLPLTDRCSLKRELIWLENGLAMHAQHEK